jgi:hypothetical protein
MLKKASNRRSSRVRRDVVLDYNQTIENQLNRPPSSSGSELSRDGLRAVATPGSRKRKVPDTPQDGNRTRSNSSKSNSHSISKAVSDSRKPVRSKATAHQGSPSLPLVERDPNDNSQSMRSGVSAHERQEDPNINRKSMQVGTTAHETALMSPRVHHVNHQEVWHIPCLWSLPHWISLNAYNKCNKGCMPKLSLCE